MLYTIIEGDEWKYVEPLKEPSSNFPVIITVYDRYDHLKNCINSLSKCKESTSTDLYIALDILQKGKSLLTFNKIKEFILSITSFRHVFLIIPHDNIGQTEALRRLSHIAFLSYDAIIVTEDDNIFSPYFLLYMNDNLRKWEHNLLVSCVCGYQYPVEIEPQFDICFLKEYCAWGVGIWKKKHMQMTDLYMQEYFYDRSSRMILRSYSYTSFNILTSSMFWGKTWGDGRRALDLVKRNTFAVFPKKTLVVNKGQDGSGLHSGINSQLMSQEIDIDFCPKHFPSFVNLEGNIQKIITKYRSEPFYKKIRYTIGRIYHFILFKLS